LSDYLLSALLGVIEGLTEFLPISSTAHLRIAQSLLGLSLTAGFWKMYAVVIQLGAILCLPVYFRGRIRQFVATYPRGEEGDRNALTHPLGLVAIAFAVTAIPSFLLTRVIGEHLESLTIMGTSLIVGGIVMWIIDARQASTEKIGPGRAAGTATAGPRSAGRIRTWKMESMGLGASLWIGACQILAAVFPGTSRSMATIAGGQLAGMSRAAALEFSFFLSMPTMAVATLYDLFRSARGTAENPLGAAGIDAHGWIVLAIGLVVSFIVAYAAVAWFMAWVRRRGFVLFALYRIGLGALVLFLRG
jgi:undecaprenyl-diphosphatase